MNKKKRKMTGKMNQTEIEAVKKDLLDSLHCAMPGIVESFDPHTRTAAVRPAAKRKGISLPLIRDVPVFFPGTRDSAVTFPVAPGDECLLVFADFDTDRWAETGSAEQPASARSHALSDAFAFVGFRSRPGIPESMPPQPSFFGISPADVAHTHDDRYYTEAETDTLLAGKAGISHRHGAGEITSGTLPLDRGGTGQAATGTTNTIAEIAAAESGVTITSAYYAWWGKVAMVRLVVTKKTAVSSGTTTLCTLVSGKRPRYTAMAEWAWNSGGQILPGGSVQVNGAIAANASLTILSTYILA